MQLEYASNGSQSVALTPAEWRVKTRHAPRWVIEQAKRGSRRPATAAAPASPRGLTERRVAGWISGCCLPGVSQPAYGSKDKKHLREQFTPRAMKQAVAEINRGQNLPKLTWGHGGPVLAEGWLDFTFRHSDLLGMGFTARLADTKLNRLVVEAAGGEGLGVSIGFQCLRQWIVDREGVGLVRVVDEFKLNHVAILPPARNSIPAFSGARCYGSPGKYLGCPREIRSKAEQFAYQLLKKQAGC